MAQIKFTNTSGGDFNTGSNWSGGVVPGASDDALLTTVGTYTVTTTQSDTVNSLQMISTVTFDINGGIFTMTNGSGSGSDNGLIAINGNNTLDLGGTLAGSGTVELNTNSYNADLALIGSITTLSGGGKIVMSDTGNNRIYGQMAGNILNNVNDTISGSGQIGVDQTGLDNQSGGVIDATGTAANLILDFGTFAAVNTGLIEATGTAGLLIQNSGSFTNTGGTLKATGAGVFLSLANSTITGGTLLTTAGGTIQTYGGNTAVLVGVTIATGSDVAINNNSTINIANTIVNRGTISLNTNGYNDVLQATSATATLTGGGAVLMSDSGANLIYGATAATKLVNVNNKISGSGQFGANQLTFDNQAAGVIDATGTYAGLTIQASASTNEGLIEDTNIGGLNINGTTITGTGTILSTGTGSFINLYNGTDIIGGTLATAKTGVIETVGGETALLDGSTKTGAITITAASLVQINNNSTLNVLGAIVNDGTIQMNADGYNNDLVIDSAIVTLSGGGHLILDDVYSNRIYGAVGTDKLINVNNTISGTGQFGVNQLELDNQAAGIIDSTGANGLTLQLTSFTNEGLVEDTGIGGLGLDATTLVNNATLAATGAGSTFNVYNSAIVEGGTLVSSGGGVFETSNTGTLDGAANGSLTLTTGSVFDINGNNTLDLVGFIVNQGTIAMNADGYDNDLIANSATVTLTGGGTIAMNDAGSNRIYGLAATNLLVNVNNTIKGSGQIGANQGSFDNQALGVIDATGTNAGITIFAQSFTNEGLIEDTNTGGVGIQSTTIVNSSTVLATGAGSTINLYNGSAIEGGTLISTNGGYFLTTNTGTLDGAAHGALTLTAGSIFDLNGNVTLDLVGSIVNHGTLALNGNGYNNDLVANSATMALSGGGSVVMDDTLGNRIYGALSTDVFANVNNTISGSGQIGAGQGTIDNQAAGIIDSTGASGIVLNATYFGNEGLIEATNTGGVTIQTSIVSSGTIAAVGAGNAVNLVNGASIEGGTLGGSGGYFETTNYGTLDGATNGALTIASTASFDLYNNSTLYVGGSIVNMGTIAMNTDGYNLDLIVNTPTVALSGGGQLIMSDAGANRIYGAVTADKLVNVSNTISGSGQLGVGQMTLDNQKAGVIDATGNGTNLNISLGSTFTNEGLVEASGPAGLLIQNTTLTNTGTIAALSGSNVNIASTATLTNYNAGTLTGGTYKAIAASGTTSTLAINSIGSITVDAAHLVLSGTGASITAGGTSVVSTLKTITSKGELDIQNGAVYADPSTLTNAGKILLAGSLTATGISNTATGSITANGGLGSIGTTGKLSNAGLLQATSGGTLQLSKGSVTNTGSIDAQAGGKVTLIGIEKNTNLVAGVLTGGNWGAIGAGATLALQDGTITSDAATLTLSGAGSVIASEKTNVGLGATLGTIAAGGILNVLSGASFASTVAGGVSDLGTISLGGAQFSVGTLTVGGGALLQGTGMITGAVVDNGQLLSSTAPVGSTGSLTVTGAISGTGILEAGAATVLAAAGGFAVGTLTVDAGGTLTGAGSVAGSVSVAGVLALGATGTLTAGGAVAVQAGGTLSGASVVASNVVADSGSLLLSGGTLSGSSITVGGGLLSGYGQVSRNVANTGTIAASGGTLTLAAGETDGALAAGAGATLVADAAIAAASLTIAAGGSFVGFGSVSGVVADSGTMTASGGTLLLASASGAGSATIASGATLESTAALTVAGVTFATGSGETLALGTPGGNTAVITGFAAGTTIDLLNTTVTSFAFNPATDTLSFKDGSTSLGFLKFTGSYVKTNFSLVSDGHNGVDITFVPSAVADLHGAVAATTGSAAAAGLAPAAPAPMPLPHAAPDLGFSLQHDTLMPSDGLMVHLSAVQ